MKNPTYNELTIELEQSELARAEQRKELQDSYDYCEMIQSMCHESNMKNIQLELLIHSLNKQLIKGKLQ